MLKSLGLALLLSMSIIFSAMADILSDNIDSIIAHDLPTANVGVVVADSDTGRVLYERQGFHSFIPASTLKLFTATAALIGLGANFRYKTIIAINPKQLNGQVLNGDLAIKFVGDPTLTVTQLRDMIKKIKTKGIHTINGNVIIDNSVFKPPYYGAGWSIDDKDWYYSAPVSSVILNQNYASYTLTSNKTLDKRASFKATNGYLSQFIPIRSLINTVTYAQALSRCSLLVDVDSDNSIYAQGCWPINNGVKYVNIAFRSPTLLARQIIRHTLQANQITIKGKLRIGKTPKQYHTLIAHQSPPLNVMLKTLLKDSNNLYTESLVKTLGNKKYHRGDFQNGVNAIQSILHDKTGINFQQLVMVDGSGLSRYDLITPRQFERLLYIIAQTPHLHHLMTKFLPGSGIDGTLAKRMKSIDLSGNVFAKTGTLRGISALAGYMTTKRGRDLIVVILTNNIVGSVTMAKSLQEDILSQLYTVALPDS